MIGFLALIGLSSIGLAVLCGLAYITWLYAGYIIAAIIIGIGLYRVIKGFLKRMWRTDEYKDEIP